MDLSKYINATEPTLLEFYADWCPHCQRMMPVVAQIKRDFEGRANIVQIEGDRNPGLMKEYDVDSFPTWILYKEGQEVWRDGGEKPFSELRDMIDRFV